MLVSQCCQKNVVSVSPDATILDVVKLMEQHNVGCVAVTYNGMPVGILTDRDIILRVIAKDKKPGSTPVHEVMTKNPMVLRNDIGLYNAISQMRGKKFRRIPIVDAEGNLTGIITLDDLFMLIVKEMSSLASILEKEGSNT